jgi:hypothetical protein
LSQLSKIAWLSTEARLVAAFEDRIVGEQKRDSSQLSKIEWRSTKAATGAALQKGVSMKEAVIVAGVRTAVGKAPRGTLRTTRPDDMAASDQDPLRRLPNFRR